MLTMSLRIAALGLLAQHPGSGYDLLKRFEKSMANVWPATQSQLYGELNKLAEAGLIEVSDIGPRGRKEYRVTPAGRAELLRWVTSPQHDPPLRRPDLLRVFLLSEVPVATAREHVEALTGHAETELARLQALRESVRWRECAADFFARAVLEYGLRNAEMEAQWGRWLTGELAQRQHGTTHSE
jgi:DNA-binding PadR family transcriptional regulator